ncbi:MULTISPECIES: MATE family efflux transporter [Congzhengia]|uniref:MATE family efflux transporter n=1 Tax=Congzhengia minquanensis TaxID=2763657 RepID=A0A926HXT2_9FIRM|nr:MATE family efflux transporter [Congzhengia minquanensis]MBC8540394.1 MATE family efflux transporter [Congzhengia minquanensis]
MNSSDLYAKVSPLKLFFMIAIPGAISMIASSLWGLFDGIFVGNFLGETAFAALNLAFPFVLINFSLADLIGVGSSVNISIFLGKKQNEEANNYFTCACLMIFATGIVVGAVLFFSAPLLMQLMGADDDLAAMAIQYIRVYALASPFTTMTFAVDNFLRICGKIKSSMALNIIMSVLILGLEYLCLSVLKMGISGSAAAVSGGMFICTIIALYPFVRKKLTLRFCKPHFALQMVRQVIAGGSPNFLSNVAGRLTSILMNIVLLKIGGTMAVSVYGVLVYVGDTLQQLLYGTCDGMQPAIGYNWGAKNIGRVKSLIQCCVAACAVISIGGTVLMLVFPEKIVSLFMQKNETELLKMCAYALPLYSFTFLTRWFGFAVQNFLVALEVPLPATILSVSNALIIPIVLLPVLWPLKLDGIWLNTPITSLLVSVLALIFFIRLRKKMIE